MQSKAGQLWTYGKVSWGNNVQKTPVTIHQRICRNEMMDKIWQNEPLPGKVHLKIPHMIFGGPPGPNLENHWK